MRILLALGAFFVLAVALTACGDGVPGNAVAKVDDVNVSRADFQHWMQVAAKGQQAPGAAGASAVPQPPEFTACVAGKRRQLPQAPKGQKPPTDTQLKTQCKQEYEGLRDQVMVFLLQSQWIQGEAADQGIKATAAEVQKQLDQTKKQSFPKEKDFQRFLKESGQSIQDILLRVRLDTLSKKLQEKVTEGTKTVSDKEITEYYDKNKRRFAQPERRDLLVVLTKGRGKADQAKRALEGGQSFSRVAKRFSIDQASKAQGGKLLGVAKGQSEKALDEAVFKAPRNQLQGPVKTQFGWYVFRVSKVTAASQQNLAQAKPTIRQLLVSQKQQKALNDFIKDYQEKWRERTNCRKGFTVAQYCKNAKEPKGGQNAPPGAVPQPQGTGAPGVVPGAQGAPPAQGGQPPPQGQPPQGTPQQAPPPQGGQGAPPPAQP